MTLILIPMLVVITVIIYIKSVILEWLH